MSESPINIQPVILSDGSGTRLWPLSYKQYRKQLLPVVGEMIVLRATANWLDSLSGPLSLTKRVILVCNEEPYLATAAFQPVCDRQPTFFAPSSGISNACFGTVK